MSGYQTVLSREWFVATESYYRQQSLSYPNSIDYKIEATIAKHRLLAVGTYFRSSISPFECDTDL